MRARLAAAARRAVVALAAACAAACASLPSAEGPVPLARHGPARAATPYAERAHDAKTALLARINADRAAAGVPPVAYDLVAAKAADAFCLDAARTAAMATGTSRAAPRTTVTPTPAASTGAARTSAGRRAGATRSARTSCRPPPRGARPMTAKKAPGDGHRRTILDPEWTHVGLGAALEGGEFRMTEEFTRHVATRVEAPAGPGRAGRTVPVRVQLPKGWKARGRRDRVREAPASPDGEGDPETRGVRVPARLPEASPAPRPAVPVRGRLARRGGLRRRARAGEGRARVRAGKLLGVRLRGAGLRRGPEARPDHGGPDRRRVTV